MYALFTTAVLLNLIMLYDKCNKLSDRINDLETKNREEWY